MPTILLIVTGDMEMQALPLSLGRFFPSKWRVDGNKGATGYRLDISKEPNSSMRRLARKMIEAFKLKVDQPDLVIVIDDAELGNIGQEDVVANHFRRATEKILEIEHKQNPAYAEKLRKNIRSRASFHLLTPMPEAYFFGDANTLSTMDIEPNKPKLRHLTDVEQFESNDPDWLTVCERKNNQKKLNNNPWWKHECHSKDYLEHLFPSYKETLHGKKALEQLPWNTIPKCPQDIRCIRALFQDLANWFAISNPIGNGDMHPAFSNFADNDQKTLRNM